MAAPYFLPRLGQTVGDLYLPNLNADIINRESSPATRARSGRR